jgi:hypothetical protein
MTALRKVTSMVLLKCGKNENIFKEMVAKIEKVKPNFCLGFQEYAITL